MSKAVLVLCVDVDNDLWEKARVRGPVLGREENIKAATKLGIADPQDSDVNTIFAAVRLYDEIVSEGERKAFLATVTGHKAQGYLAAKEIANQLDTIVQQTGVDSCILVTDGRSDEEVLPVIKSRLRIEASKLVVVKQAKELEKTYFVILEKLKDPYYSRIILGVPALLIFLFSLASLFGMGWQPIGIIVGLYLMAKGFGIDAFVVEIYNDFRTSLTKASWVSYLVSVALLGIALFSAVQAFVYESQRAVFVEQAYAAALKNFITVFPWAALFLLAGKWLDALLDRQFFRIFHYATYAVGVLLISLVVDVVSTWVYNEVKPYITFGQVVASLIFAVFLGLAANFVIKELKRSFLRRSALVGKRVVSETGSIIGKVVGLDMRANALVVSTPLERALKIRFADIKDIDGEDIYVSL